MLTKAVEAYIALKQALGYSFQRSAGVLRSFARFATERGDEWIHTTTVMAWSRLACSVKERDNRLRTVVAFAKHARAEEPRHEISPADVYGYRKWRPVPFIFTPEQIGAIVTAASRLGPPGSLRPHTYSTLFALLACTGLRISEALGLCLEDLTAGGLVIRETKFRKNRLVPLHETAKEGLQSYLSRRLRLPSADSHVFVDGHGDVVRYSAVHQVFRKLTKHLGLYRGQRPPVPRIHSMRHTFAVRALERCPHSREHVGRHLVALSTYLGHCTVAATYWYLEATPELMKDISTAMERLIGKGTR